MQDTPTPDDLEDSPTPDYFWVVTCKNSSFHQNNLHYAHHILLAETDYYASRPALPDEIRVRCDSCGGEYSYKKEEVLRGEVRDIPERFTPHPMFPRLC